MVLIPAGPFEMGSDPEVGLAACQALYIGSEDDCQRSWFEDEAPVHTVTLDAFYIDQYEVTNARFATFLNEADNQTEGGVTWLDAGDKDVRIQKNGEVWQAVEGFADHPVTEVSWYGAKAYCESRGHRLPTEAEWEKAARGTDGRTYPWGEGIDCDLANYGACSTNNTTPVGSYPAGGSPYEVYDMAGNVWEWVQSEKQPYPYQVDDGRENSTSTNVRVLRGGSWNFNVSGTRSSNRNGSVPSNAFVITGFRCAR